MSITAKHKKNPSLKDFLNIIKWCHSERSEEYNLYYILRFTQDDIFFNLSTCNTI
ncbi:MAG: hypothetical protein ACD_80C00097G0009 [uncultured bacterium (gcode 4)]|uniref:Uncharacterized protein n=1 Tax=uncultured bacterium (gcode 4) TaxID=1234023 RepID=K1XJ75_9BACT|nr:MAG: hypothetical protein ACD_80C00097G0009 [uncultured bacterium (gcode 4)]